MRALTLTQPWATLVAIGAKRIETRSWLTTYRGPLAIHAAKGFPAAARERCFEPPFRAALMAAGYESVGQLPLGSVVATCRVVAVFSIGRWERSCELPTLQANAPLLKALSDEVPVPEWVTIPPDEPERSFGDYSPGRYAWVLDNVQALAAPVPATGSLGLWEWKEKA